MNVDPESSIRSCLKLLCNPDLDQNRLGLQRLKLLTKGKTISGLFRSEIVVSYVLVYGGELGSFQEALRYVFVTIFCDAPHRDSTYAKKRSQKKRCHNKYDGRDDDSTNPYLDDDDDDVRDSVKDCYCAIPASLQRKEEATRIRDVYGIGDEESDADSWSTDGEEGAAQGKSWGALHSSALQVLVHALSHVTASPRHNLIPIPLQDTIWRNIIRSLVHNIETNHTAEITGYSLKILRLLQSIHPTIVNGLLRQSLFPHLVGLSEQYHGDQRFQMIHHESSCLLKRATEKRRSYT